MNYVIALAFGLMLPLAAGCSTPATSRTAVIKDIIIADTLSPDKVLVHPGDEIRWVNLRKDNVQLDIPKLPDKDLACQRGFSGWLGGTKESVPVKPNDTVSLCFDEPTVVNYNVRAQTAAPGGKQVMSGIVRVAETR